MLDKTKPIVMGILNVTPDSFSDGGSYSGLDSALKHAQKMIDQGADIIDVGGESTRPGSDYVDEQEEIGRVIPVIKELSSRHKVIISVDTVKSSVAIEAMEAGAQMINDVSMLRADPNLATVAAQTGAHLVLMHSRKTPKNMQEDIQYGNVIQDVCWELMNAVSIAETAGVESSKIWLDPGIGFAKTLDDNLELLARISTLVDLGYPVLVGPSRKSFINKLDGSSVESREGGTAAAVTQSIMGGATAVRVHDVALMKQAALVAHAMNRFTGRGVHA